MCGGVAAYVLIVCIAGLYALYSSATLAEWFLSMLVGALFPDIDTKSKIQKIMYRILLVSLPLLMIYVSLAVAGVLSVFCCVPLVVSHRGMFHSWWFLALFPTSIAFCFSYYFPQYYFLIISNVCFFVIGCWVHLLLDFGIVRLVK